MHLNEIAQAVAPEAHALVLVDQAGWHQSKKLGVPANITLVPLPSKAPELNPVENIWEFYVRELDLEPDLRLLRRHRAPHHQALDPFRRKEGFGRHDPWANGLPGGESQKGP